ncbi:sensor histidine kinase [Chitinophaga solisilvae]|uniref:sensor histidine kinase n=1 Tax=Chitinophaga solisilvae TaxID=1233460 RepID=UPI00136CC326|nr:sensor histidine kinase [Chitinophaga solisilvae]
MGITICHPAATPLQVNKPLYLRILLHLAPAITLYAIAGMNQFRPEWQPAMKAVAALFLLAAPYVNIYLLVPALLLRFRYLAYALSVLLLISVLLLFTIWMQPLFTPLLNTGEYFTPLELHDTVVFFVMMLALIAASTTVQLFRHWMAASRQRTDNLRTELENLKRQLSPHFVFNTLNNLDTLIYADQHRASEVVHALSRLLRHQLYLSGDNKVPLQQELDFLQDYLYLEQLRHDALDITPHISGDIQQVTLHAMLLIPFIENAAKHNDYNGNAYINFSLTVNSDKLEFSCINPLGMKPAATTGGAGLQNVRRRLALLYPGQHELHAAASGNIFTVQLTLHI